jgi:excisionase family DNA binding protein
METKLMKPAEVADYLKVSRAQIYAMLKRGQIPSVRIGYLVRVKLTDLEQFILEHTTTRSEPVSSEA